MNVLMYSRMHYEYIILCINYSFAIDGRGGTCRARVAFQVRIRPDSYEVGPRTVGSDKIDPKIHDNELEWFTKRRCVTVLVGLLVKIEGLEEVSRPVPDTTKSQTAPSQPAQLPLPADVEPGKVHSPAPHKSTTTHALTPAIPATPQQQKAQSCSCILV